MEFRIERDHFQLVAIPEHIDPPGLSQDADHLAVVLHKPPRLTAVIAFPDAKRPPVTWHDGISMNVIR
jgi:hypothetical protein